MKQRTLIVWNPEVVSGLIDEIRKQRPFFYAEIKEDLHSLKLDSYFAVKILEALTKCSASSRITLAEDQNISDILDAFNNETYSTIHHKVVEHRTTGSEPQSLINDSTANT